MTFADAVTNLQDGKAAKRPTWHGYVKRDNDSTFSTTGKYTLTYRKANGTDYVYQWNGTAWVEPTMMVDIDAELHASMIADDWITGSTEDFETCRQGGHTW